MRKSIFDIIDNSPICFEKEIARVYTLFSKHITTRFHGSIEEYIDEYLFLKWKYRGTYLSVSEMKSDLQISKPDLDRKTDLDTMLCYFEFVANMVDLFLSKKDESVKVNLNLLFSLTENITRTLEKLNYETKTIDKEKIIIVAKNPAANAVAEVHEEVSQKVIEYNRFQLKGDLERKREILQALSDKFETLRPKLESNNYVSLASDTGFLLNKINIRHNNKEGKNRIELIATISADELEKWYDTTYDLLLTSILCCDHIDKKKDIKDLKDKITL